MNEDPAGEPDPGRYAGPEYRRLLANARRSLERTGGRLTGRVSVSLPHEAERLAIIGLTGVHQPVGTKRLTISLAALDAATLRSDGIALEAVLAAVSGPLRDRPAEAASLETARARLIAVFEGGAPAGGSAWYQAWLAELRRDGTFTRLARQGDIAVAEHAAGLLDYLETRPSTDPPIALPELAARITGDTKALNHGTTLATLILRALALRAGTGRPESAAQRRELWDLSNVLVDDLASRVLVLNLAAEGNGLAQWLTGAASHGTPFQVTLHQLASYPIRLRQRRIFVCENPAILRRACAELGPDCPPVLCTEGQPSTAFRRLARIAVESGAQLWYHGDFDWPGVSIAADIIGQHDARAWLMGASDYLRGAGSTESFVALDGDAVPTPWDPELSEVMRATGRAVYEEMVADQVLADLARP